MPAAVNTVTANPPITAMPAIRMAQTAAAASAVFVFTVPSSQPNATKNPSISSDA